MVNRIDQYGPDSIGGAKPVEPTRPGLHKPEGVSRKPSETVDRATISPDAAEVARYQELSRLHREAYGPADRESKLTEVRSRIESGYYDRPEVLDQIASDLIEGAVVEAARASDSEIAQRRIRDGFYDRPEVVDRTAEKVLKQVMGNRGRVEED